MQRLSLSVGPGIHWLQATRTWLAVTLLPWQGAEVSSGQNLQLCLSPCNCELLRRRDLGLRYGLEPSVYCREGHLLQYPRCSLWTVLPFTTFHQFSPHVFVKGGALTTFHRRK